jgi:hypothetical protein
VGQGISVDDCVAAGVLGRGERGPYDFFRQRITIPIRNARGDVVSFGGRIFGAAAGMAMFFWRRNTLLTIVAGMVVYLPLHLGLGW